MKWMTAAIGGLLLAHGAVSRGQEGPPVSAELPSKLQLRVVETRRVSLGNRSVIFNRVEPPVLPSRPTAGRSPAAAPTAEELQVLEDLRARYPEKRREALFVTARMLSTGVADLRWTHGGRNYQAFSNINFSYFDGVVEFESVDTVFVLFMAVMKAPAEANVGDGSAVTVAGGVRGPALAEFSQTRSEYFAATDDETAPAPSEAYAAIDALHVHFDAHRQSIIEESARRAALRAAEERRARGHPPIPKDTVITYWPKKSRMYPTQAK